ncbi:AMP-binding protein [Haloechinothrix sp. YIM 98757]|uniref:AMP-binding protein n=1 Tax=Haloechinothrix aidingensis TaxID=2752311 RepID=A0A837ZZL6_9PSEU|nr:AMP-binding protein [Haloechinothrix aidingensis]
MSSVRTSPTAEGVVPWPADAAARYRAEGYWEGIPLAQYFIARAEASPAAVAVVDGSTRLTYAELLARADGAALRLRELGLRPDDRIVVQLPNCWEFIALVIGCLRLGVVPVMALPAHRDHELSHLVEHAEARAIAVPDELKGFDHVAMAHRIAERSSTVEHVLVTSAAPGAGSVDLRQVCAPAGDPARAREELDSAPPDPGSVAVFLLSGGTTGLPKLIPRTHDDYAYNAKRSAAVCGFDSDTVYLGVLPLSHNFPLACPGILGTFIVGGRVVLTASPDPAKVFDLIERERVTATAVVPAAAQRWLEFRDADTAHDLSSLGLLQVGGARLAPELARRVGPVLGCTLQQVFGMAEGLLNYTRLDDPDEVIVYTQGRPMCEADEIRVVDESDTPVPAGEAGILLTRGPYTPRGYYRAAAHNAKAFTGDGWYRSGDIVRVRPDGNLVVEGRDKDMINRGGENVSAEEVENIAYRLPAVSQAAAVAMPDRDVGERVCVYVVVRPGERLTLEELRSAYEQARVGRYKWPERLVVVDEIPQTKVGKIDKKALRADIARRLEEEGSHPG